MEIIGNLFIIKIKTAMSFILIAVFLTSFSQNKKIFSEYSSISFHSSMDNYFGGKSTGIPNDSPVKFTRAPFSFLSIGINAKVLEKERFNLKVGVQVSYLQLKDNIEIESNQLQNNEYILMDFSSLNRFRKYGLPITGEYTVNKKRNNKLTVFATLFPSYWLLERENLSIINSSSNQSIKYAYAIASNKSNRFYFDTQIGIGYYIPTKYFLIQPFIHYNKSFRNIWEGPYAIWGISNRPYTEIEGVASQSGDHFSFGFNLYFKKAKKSS
jgi:hypothetical protein